MKKLLILLLVACLCIPFAACDKGTGSTDTAGSEAPTAAPTGAPTEAPGTMPVENPTEPATEAATQSTGKSDPVITLSSTEDITVKAGETVDLPTYTCKDYDGRDLTSWVEIEDNTEMDSISAGKFTGSTAGDHTLYYFVETTDGRLGEAFLTVHVTPVHENTFDAQGADDCENMANYKVFRDGFEKGRRSVLYNTIGDAGKATVLSAGEDAIEGNSLVVDFAKSAGSSATAIFLNGFNDYFHYNIQATYKVSFSYKLVEANNNTGDIYIGLSWDGSNGINRQFIPASAEVGKVYTYTAEFPSAIVPEGGSSYFFIFKLNKSNDPIVVAFDNFVIETIELEQVKSVVPTADEAAKGFTWDFTENGALCDDGMTVAVSTLPDEIKNAISGRDGFGENVLKLTRANDHRYSGLTESILTPGKKLILEMDYYAVNDQQFYLIMMGRSGNPTQTIENTADGAFHHVRLETNIQSGWYQLNIYALNNSDFEIYIGNITIRVAELGAEDANKSLNGFEFGMTFSKYERTPGWGLIDNGKLTMSAYDGYDFGEYADKMGDAPTKFTFHNGSDCLIEWFRTEGKIESGYRYRLTVTYFVTDAQGDGKLMYCMDRAAFPEFGEGDYMTPGFHELTTEWVADLNVDYFCFYLDQGTLNGSLYVKGVTVELLGK